MDEVVESSSRVTTESVAEVAAEAAAQVAAEVSNQTNETPTENMTSTNDATSALEPNCSSAAPAKSEDSAGADQASDEATSEPVPSKEIPMPTGPKTRYDWYQTDTHVIVTVMMKHVKKDDLNVDIQETTLSVTIKMPGGSDYSLELDLAHPVVPAQSQTKLLSTKVEIKMKKSEGIRWTKLEGDATLDTKVKQFSITDKSTDDTHKYPTSAHYTRNWDKLVAEITEEEKKEKLEGDAAVNQLFQNIYGDGSDEVKKAMNKSFVESGGTVLSTNWKDIGAKQTEMKPPDGMEFKKY